MIEKIFKKGICISCAKETPVIFIIRDLTNSILYTIPLCRECSDKFAEDKINLLKSKLENKKINNISLKKKVKQMNIKSSNHKKVITQMYKNEAEKKFIKED